MNQQLILLIEHMIFTTYVEGVEKLRKHGIRVCSHIINGLAP